MRRAIILAAFFCAACTNYSANFPSIKPYKMDIQQGNVVTSKMMMQLRPGMTKSQVRFIMGTPLIADSFHADRWDYLYRMQKGGRVIEQRHVILEFESDQLKRVRGDVIPAGSGEAVAAEGAARPAEKAKEKGLADRLKFWKGDEKQAPAKLETQPELAREPGPAEVKAPEPKAAPAAPAPAAPSREAQPAAAPAPEKAPAEPAPAPKAETQAAEPAPAPAEPPRAEAKAPPRAAAPAPALPQPAEPVPEARRPTIPADELPPEDDPGYFERMLEKIGF